MSLDAIVLLDQTHVRNAAKALGLKPSGTIFVLLAAFQKNILIPEAYPDCLEDLVKAGFRMSDEIYLEAVRLGRRKK